MVFCPHCGAKSSGRFCSHCGKSIHRSFLPFILLFFVLILATGLFFVHRTTKTVSDPTLVLPLSEEQVTHVAQEIKDIKAVEEQRKEGYLNNKPFEAGDYAYDERTVDFRFVCRNPCPIPKAILDQEFASTSYAVSTLRGLTQSDIDPSVLPFEIHATVDARCPYIQGAAAYKTMFTDTNNYTRGLLCFFYDFIPYDRSKFPYSTSVHEVTHLFEEKKYTSNKIIDEGLSEMMESFFVKGNDKNSFCWNGNAWFKDVLTVSHDPHFVGGDLFFNLCNLDGFDYSDLPALFHALDARKGNTTTADFIHIINGIVGRDTNSVFKDHGVV